MDYQDLDKAEITLLRYDQLIGYNKIDRMCEVTDFAVLLGADSTPERYKGNCIRNGDYYTQTPYTFDTDVTYSVRYTGNIEYCDLHDREISIRPVIQLPDDINIKQDFIEFGEYPQYVVDSNISNMYFTGKLEATGKEYTVDCGTGDREKFIPDSYKEYEYNGKKYIYVTSRAKIYSSYFTRNKSYWVEVSPIKWYVDHKSKLLISEKLLLSGLEFTKRKRYDGFFRYTDLYNYLNTYFKKDIVPSKIQNKELDSNKFKSIINDNKKQNKEKQIQELINQIKEELQYYYGDIDYINIIKNLHQEYLNEIDRSDIQGLTTNETNKEMIFNRYMTNLNNILNELKLVSERNKKYVEMLDIIKEWKDIIDNNTDNEYKNSVSKDLKTLSNAILPLLNDDNEKNKLLKILEEEENKVTSFILNDNASAYISIDDLEHSFRIKFQDYLLSIIDKINKNELLIEIIKGYEDIIEDKKLDVRNNYIKSILESIQKYTETINEFGSEEEKERLQLLLQKDIDYNHDIINVLNQLNRKQRQIYRILLDAEKRVSEENDKNSYKINISI